MDGRLHRYVDKEENGSFERFYDKQIRETQTKLMRGSAGATTS